MIESKGIIMGVIKFWGGILDSFSLSKFMLNKGATKDPSKNLLGNVAIFFPTEQSDLDGATKRPLKPEQYIKFKVGLIASGQRIKQYL